MSDTSRVFQLLGFVQDDMRRSQANLIEIRAILASLGLKDTGTTKHVCPECGFDRGTEEKLQDHLQNVHGLPVALREAA